jgi:hypothetical protein
MTIQTKQFIEPSDILAVRFDCLHCGASVALAVSREFSLETLGGCPNCRRPWLKTSDNSIASTVKACVDAIDKTVATLHEWKNTMKALHHPGFSLFLEVKKTCDDKE